MRVLPVALLLGVVAGFFALAGCDSVLGIQDHSLASDASVSADGGGSSGAGSSSGSGSGSSSGGDAGDASVMDTGMETGTSEAGEAGAPCTGDGDCLNGYYCAQGGICTIRKPQGGACDPANDCNTAGCTECASAGGCVDGFCCNLKACPGCRACNVAGSEGTCSNAAAGTDPHSTCAADPAGCLQAKCNGQGSCTAPDGTACGTPTCASGQETFGVCTGGTCTVSMMSCGGFACAGDVCGAGTCTKETDCQTGYYCASGGMCTAQQTLGGACAATDCLVAGCPECASTNCVDGVCCNMPASQCGGCLQCNLPGSPGTCADALVGTNPHGNCVADVATCVGSSCSGAGNCNAPDGTACAASSCGASATTAGMTETDHLCQTGACTTSTKACTPYVCGATACAMPCATDQDCIKTDYCAAGGKCRLQKAAGASCGPADCEQPNCSECVGVCTLGTCVSL